MATQSFDEDMRIETEEQCRILIEMFEEADRRPREEPMVPSMEERLQRGAKLLKEGFLDNFFL
jgi:hypothetical protein